MTLTDVTLGTDQPRRLVPGAEPEPGNARADLVEIEWRPARDRLLENDEELGLQRSASLSRSGPDAVRQIVRNVLDRQVHWHRSIIDPFRI